MYVVMYCFFWCRFFSFHPPLPPPFRPWLDSYSPGVAIVCFLQSCIKLQTSNFHWLIHVMLYSLLQTMYMYTYIASVNTFCVASDIFFYWLVWICSLASLIHLALPYCMYNLITRDGCYNHQLKCEAVWTRFWIGSCLAVCLDTSWLTHRGHVTVICLFITV